MQKPRKRLIKAKLKEDKLLVFIARAQRIASDYQKQILYGAGGLLLLAIVIVTFNVSKASAEREASFEAFLAKDAYNRGDLEEALIKTTDIVEDFSGTRASIEMMMLKARVHEHRSEYEDAERIYQDVIRKGKSNMYLAFGAYFALGAIQLGRGDFEQAAKYYKTAAAKYPDHFQASVSLIEAGRCYKRAGQTEQARQVFKRILKDYPKSRAAGSLRSDLEEIEFIN